MIRLVSLELNKLLDEFDGDVVKHTDAFGMDLTPVIEVGEHRIEAVQFID